jgi:hypothetical protein
MQNHNSKLKIHHLKFAVSALVFTLVERALQKNLFLQNKAKLTQLGQSGQFHPSFLRQKPTSNFTRQKNEPKTNPIQTQTKPISKIYKNEHIPFIDNILCNTMTI